MAEIIEGLVSGYYVAFNWKDTGTFGLDRLVVQNEEFAALIADEFQYQIVFFVGNVNDMKHPTYPCETKGCPGDGRYMPPGRGHLTSCDSIVKPVFG